MSHFLVIESFISINHNFQNNKKPVFVLNVHLVYSIIKLTSSLWTKPINIWNINVKILFLCSFLCYRLWFFCFFFFYFAFMLWILNNKFYFDIYKMKLSFSTIRYVYAWHIHNRVFFEKEISLLNFSVFIFKIRLYFCDYWLRRGA